MAIIGQTRRSFNAGGEALFGGGILLKQLGKASEKCAINGQAYRNEGEGGGDSPWPDRKHL